MERECIWFRLFWLVRWFYLWVSFVELQIVIAFQLAFSTHSSRKWAHFNVSDTPVLGCTLRTFRQRPAANLWLYAIMIIYYTTNECAQQQQQLQLSSSKKLEYGIKQPSNAYQVHGMKMRTMFTTKIVHIICKVPKIHLNNNEMRMNCVAEVEHSVFISYFCAVYLFCSSVCRSAWIHHVCVNAN